MTEINPLFARDQRDQITLDLFRRLARRQSHPTRESLYVCIDHDSRGDAKRRSQNDVSRLSPDARQLGQFVEIARDSAHHAAGRFGWTLPVGFGPSRERNRSNE